MARGAELGIAPVEAGGLALGLVTVGVALEARAAALQAEGRLAEALLLEAAGSAAAEEAAEALSTAIAAACGAGCWTRRSPGFPGWDLAWQPALLGALEAGALGVRLGTGLMMTPRKSVSFALWLDPAEPPPRDRCEGCGSVDCAFRQSAKSESQPQALSTICSLSP